ncbi:hypothetical protein G7Y89_g4815 [Cudoniella acicularis]|uniref:Nephrocystin 3-like N-terminal domain-containing protein n=1 Tax=Cudoniella acicularis TaxID=354080 RepID=A0A8H4W724_9HELO|nr:hypothetical protein G7Y89_g4815 [Cudoniella acicularis]
MDTPESADGTTSREVEESDHIPRIEIDGERRGDDIDLTELATIVIDGKIWEHIPNAPFLPEFEILSLFPYARALSYGYDTIRTKERPFTAAGITAKAMHLLDDLVELRKEVDQTLYRPVVFISHDIGGIIVKEVGFTNCWLKPQNYGPIKACTQLLIFFGCPHRCTSIQNMEDQVANLLFNEPTPNIPLVNLAANFVEYWIYIKELATSIVNTNDAFVGSNLVSRIGIINVFSVVSDLSRQIFNKFATTLNVPFEKQVCTTSPHNDLIKFDGYSVFQNSIEEMLNKDPSASPTQPLKTHFPSREQLRWIDNNPVFKRWLESRDPSIIHIYGAFDMSDVSQEVFHILDRSGSESITDYTLLYFTFDKHNILCNSISGKLTTLLAQVFSHNKNLYRFLGTRVNEMIAYRSWTQKELFVLFRDVLFEGHILCVIDGLDQCVDSRIEFLTSLFAFMATTKYRSNSQPLAPDLAMELQELISQRPDLDKYEPDFTKCLLKCGSDKNWSRLIMSAIRLSKAHVTKSYEGWELEMLENFTAPTTTFEWILERVPPGERSLALHVLRWISHAFRPLSPGELGLVLNLQDEDLLTSAQLLDFNSFHYHPLISHLNEIFRGLIIVRHNTLHFAHPETRDFLVTAAEQQMCHAMLVDWVLWYSNAMTRYDRSFLSWSPLFASLGLQDLLEDSLLRDEEGPDSVAYRSLALAAAAKYGHVELNETLVEELVNHALVYDPAFKFPEEILRRAAQCELLGVARKILTSNSETINNSNTYNGQDSLRPLHIAVVHGHVAMAKLLLEHKADIALKNYSGRTPLHSAALEGQAEMVKLLLDSGSDVDCKEDYGKTPIEYGCMYGCYKVVQILADVGCNLGNDAKNETGANPNEAHPSDSDVLILTAADGNMQIAKLLIENGAAVDAVDSGETTALLRAALWGHKTMAAYLLDQGANINHVDKFGKTALSFACEDFPDSGLVPLLIEREADVDRADADGSTPLHLSLRFSDISRILLENHAYLKRLDSKGNSPVSSAIISGFTDALQVFPDFDFDLEMECIQGRRGWPLLQLAVREHKIEMMRMLLEAGANVNHTFSFNKSTLHWAIVLRRPEMVQLLMECNPNLGALNETGHTPLGSMTRFTPVEIARLLVNGGLDIEFFNKARQTPFGNMILNENVAVVKYLIQKKAKVDTVGGHWGGPLHIACSRPHLEIMQILVEAETDEMTIHHLVNGKGADVTTEGGSLGCALNAIAGFSSPEMVRLLLDKGAKVNKKDLQGRVAIHFAAARSLENFQAIYVAGGDIEAKDKTGRTCLHWAVIGGFIEAARASRRLSYDLIFNSPMPLDIIKLLLERGADPCVKGKGIDFEWPPVKVANYHGAPASFIELLTTKAKERLAEKGEEDSWDAEFHSSKQGYKTTNICGGCLTFPLFVKVCYFGYNTLNMASRQEYEPEVELGSSKEISDQSKDEDTEDDSDDTDDEDDSVDKKGDDAQEPVPLSQPNLVQLLQLLHTLNPGTPSMQAIEAPRTIGRISTHLPYMASVTELAQKTPKGRQNIKSRSQSLPLDKMAEFVLSEVIEEKDWDQIFVINYTGFQNQLEILALSPGGLDPKHRLTNIEEMKRGVFGGPIERLCAKTSELQSGQITSFISCRVYRGQNGLSEGPLADPPPPIQLPQIKDDEDRKFYEWYWNRTRETLRSCKEMHVPHVYIQALVTDPVWQNHGAATMLMNWVFDFVEKEGIGRYKRQEDPPGDGPFGLAPTVEASYGIDAYQYDY